MKNILKLLCFLPLTVFGQVSQNENYVHVTTYQESVSETTSAAAPEDAKIESITYYDGLGRVKQTTQLRAGGNKEDIIIPVARDEFGRTTRSYLPYAVGGNQGAYRNNALEELNGFYNTQKYEYTANPYSETITEISPLNRVEEAAAPGNPWAYTAENIQYENPVYSSYPTSTTYSGYWTAQEIFYVPDLPNDGSLIIGVNFLSINIANGNLRLRADWEKISNGTTLLTGKLQHIDVYPTIKKFDMGAIKDKLGNNTDYQISIEDNYVIIRKTLENPALLTEGIAMDSTYDLTQVQILSSYTDTYTTNHTIKAGYGLNIADEVARFDVVITAGIPALISNGYYPAGELIKAINKDENWTAAADNDRTTEGFTNKSGQTLLERSYNQGEAHDTYSIYDDFGNLTYVIPPKVIVVDGVSDSELAELCYQYRYDERNRLVEKKIPGKGWESIVYNRLDQPLMTQDALQKNRNEWSFIAYDIYGRIAYTGIVQSSNEREALQLEADNSSSIYVHKQTVPSTIAGTHMYYDNNTFPTDIYKIHTINYYDDYRFATAQEAAPNQVFGQNITAVAKSLPTGSKIRVLGTDDWISSIIYYDNKARSVYSYSTNTYLNTIDHTKILYDFVGRALKSRVSHSKDTNAPIVTQDTFIYDHMGRLVEQYQCIGDNTLSEDCDNQNTGSNEESIESSAPITTTTDLVASTDITLTPGFSFTATASTSFSATIRSNNSAEMLVNNTYDELGVLQNMAVGNTKESPLQIVDYAYNVRGWLTDINDIDAIGNDLFSFRVSYDAPAHGAQALYNGNIAAIDWKTANDRTHRWYTYDYDPMNRIKQATDNTNRYSLHTISYDKNGNILSLVRKGHTNAQATSFGTMDALTYGYGIGNTLEKVTDTSGNTFGFTDGNNTNIDYEYDVNGNMIKDRNKQITDIAYNHFNLPTEVSIGTGTVTYVYDATGGKQKKIITEGSAVTTTEYAGNYSYKNGILEFFGQAQGYIEPNGTGDFEYIYQYKDHLGNIRLSYADKDGDGHVDVLRNNTDIDGDGDAAHEILAENNYYPFGLQHRGYNNLITGREHNFKYNNTELTEDLGYNMYEMPLRAYDPAIARWNRIDPVVHHGLSPYNAFDNNPVFYADPSGGDSEWANNWNPTTSSDHNTQGSTNGYVDSSNWGISNVDHYGGADFWKADEAFRESITFAIDNNSKKGKWVATAGDGYLVNEGDCCGWLTDLLNKTWGNIERNGWQSDDSPLQYWLGEDGFTYAITKDDQFYRVGFSSWEKVDELPPMGKEPIQVGGASGSQIKNGLVLLKNGNVKSTLVYFAREGKRVIYVGITNNFAVRAATHLRKKGINIEEIPGLSNLSRYDARAIEQTLIETYGLGKNGGSLINRINSISQKNPIYGESLKRGYELLQTVGF